MPSARPGTARSVVLAALVAALVTTAIPASGQIDVPVSQPEYGFQGEGGGYISDADLRAGGRAPTAAQSDAVAALGARATWNAFGTPQVLIGRDGPLTGPADGDAGTVARAWVRANAALFRLDAAGADALEVVQDSRLHEAPDLARLARGEDPTDPDVAHVVLFRQSFDGIAPSQDGLLTVAVDRRGRIVGATSSVTGDTAISNREAISAVDAYRIAAGDVGRAVDASALTVVDEATPEGFTTYRMDGVEQLQYTRRTAVPTPDRGVRLAWETVVLENSAGAQPVGFAHFIDAETGEVLVRRNGVNHLAEPTAGVGAASAGAVSAAAEPTTGEFSGTTTTTVPYCGEDHPFDVGEDNDQITVLANSAAGEDVVINLDYVLAGLRTRVASQDLLTSPEALTYAPPGGVPPGEYIVTICAFDDAAGENEIAYTGSFIASPAPTAGVGQPRWATFPANPPFRTPGEQGATPDTRETWCWTPGTGCDRILGQDGQGFVNGASRAPYDVDSRTQLPTFTTLGNNATTAASYVSPLTPDTVIARPVAPDRDYTFPYTDQWFVESCNPANFGSPARNDLDAATANLFLGHNRMHDWGYYLGWTELNSAFQQSNFGNTDLDRENDPETGQSQAGSIAGGPTFLGRDNANQITLQDGIPGISNQYLWQPLQAGFYPVCVDGAYDMSVVGHEVGHGVQNRMTAGPDGQLSGQQARSMGESWSDLTAIEYLNGNGLVPVADENPFSVGAFVTGDKESGIRNYGMDDSPLNFSDIEYDGNGTTSPHADGEIWSAANFDLRQRLVADYDAEFPADDQALQTSCAEGQLPADQCPGNRRWIQIVHDGFLVQPSATSMVDSRDAQLMGDMMRFDGANQEAIWDAYAARGLGETAASDTTEDRQPIPGWSSPLRDDEAQVTFEPFAVADGGVPDEMSVYVGDYEARATPTAVAAGGAPSDPVAFVPGTYEFIAQAPGFGAFRFTQTFAPGEERLVQVPLRANRGSLSNGAIADGDGGNFEQLIDDTESTNYASFEEGDVRGKQVTVTLPEARPVREVQVSAALRPAMGEDPAEEGSEPDPDDPDDEPEEPPYDSGGQNRFSAVRQFEILTCDTGAGSDCSADEDYTSVLVSADDAFPGTRPRPTSPDLTLRPFDVEDSTATHVRLRVLQNQCTGGPEYAGEANPDDDPTNDPDCVEGTTLAGAAGGDTSRSLSQADVVRVAELQVFSEDAPTMPEDSGVPVLPPGVPGGGDDGDDGDGDGDGDGAFAITRVGGDDRVQTAIELSRRAFESADTVVLARADDWPDALAASTLAAEVEGPVLLTGRDALDPLVATEIERLGAGEVYLLGGVEALTPQVEQDVTAADLRAERRGGADRIATAALISGEVVALGGPVSQAIVARADDFVDALAAGNVATTGRAPLLLTPTDELADATAAALERDVEGDAVFIAGGDQAVDATVEQALADAGYSPTRLAGSERYATARVIADEAIAQGADPDPALLASGVNFPDALTAVPAAHQLGGLVLLVDPFDLADSGATETFLTENVGVITTVIVAGGVEAIADEVVAQVEAILGA